MLLFVRYGVRQGGGGAGGRGRRGGAQACFRYRQGSASIPPEAAVAVMHADEAFIVLLQQSCKLRSNNKNNNNIGH